MTQRQRVLHLLREAGDRGVHSFEMIQLGIPRVAARVHELQQDGHTIRSERSRFQGTAEGSRYTLVSVPVESWPAVRPVDLLGEAEGLFVQPAVPRPHYMDDAA